MADERNTRHFAPSRIDYQIFSQALDHYEQADYPYMEAPWVVSERAERVTLPLGAVATSVQYGDLVGSGEQSFIELMMHGTPIGRASCITPCFRLEERYDELHHGYFMKMELIDTESTTQNLDRMIKTAMGFFARYLDVLVIKTGENAYDIVSKHNEIELGSYGFRSFDDTTFIYGTGVALPRLSYAVNAQRQTAS